MAPASLHFYECGPQTKNLNTRDLKKKKLKFDMK